MAQPEPDNSQWLRIRAAIAKLSDLEIQILDENLFDRTWETDDGETVYGPTLKVGNRYIRVGTGEYDDADEALSYRLLVAKALAALCHTYAERVVQDWLLGAGDAELVVINKKKGLAALSDMELAAIGGALARPIEGDGPANEKDNAERASAMAKVIEEGEIRADTERRANRVAIRRGRRSLRGI